MKAELQTAYQLAAERSLKSHQRNKRYYDKKMKHQHLEKGDRVLIRNLVLTGKHKLQDKWKSLPYIVTEQLENLPVYKLKPETGMGGVKTLHRDHLLLIGDNVRFLKPDTEIEVIKSPVTRANTAKKEQFRREKETGKMILSLEMSSEDDEENWYYYENPDWISTLTKPLSLDFPEPVVVEEEVASRAENNHPPEELMRENPRTEIEEDNSSYVIPGSKENPLIDGEEGQCRHSPIREINIMESRPKRKVKPVVKLSYDELGEPSDQPLSIAYGGMLIRVEGLSQKRYSCSTVWCHPLKEIFL